MIIGTKALGIGALVVAAIAITGCDPETIAKVQAAQQAAAQGLPAAELSRTSFRHQYWTLAQMVTQHTVGGCNLQSGDLLGTGTGLAYQILQAGYQLNIPRMFASLLLITLAVAGLVGIYASCTCRLPPTAPLLSLPELETGALTNADGSPNWSARTLADLAAALVRHGVELVSTGGTAKALREAVIAGALPIAPSAFAARPLAYSRAQWMPQGWQWVDPLRDVQANVEAINNKLKAPQDVANEMGEDYEDVLVSIKAAQDMAAKLGIAPAATKPAAPAAGADPQQPAT